MHKTRHNSVEQFGLTLKWALLTRLDWRPLKILSILNGFMAAPSYSPKIRIYTKKWAERWCVASPGSLWAQLPQALSGEYPLSTLGSRERRKTPRLRKPTPEAKERSHEHHSVRTAESLASPWDKSVLPHYPASPPLLFPPFLKLSYLTGSSLWQGSSSPEVQALNLGLCR